VGQNKDRLLGCNAYRFLEGGLLKGLPGGREDRPALSETGRDKKRILRGSYYQPVLRRTKSPVDFIFRSEGDKEQKKGKRHVGGSVIQTRLRGSEPCGAERESGPTEKG